MLGKNEVIILRGGEMEMLLDSLSEKNAGKLISDILFYLDKGRLPEKRPAAVLHHFNYIKKQIDQDNVHLLSKFSESK